MVIQCTCILIGSIINHNIIEYKPTKIIDVSDVWLSTGNKEGTDITHVPTVKDSSVQSRTESELSENRKNASNAAMLFYIIHHLLDTKSNNSLDKARFIASKECK